MKDIPGAPTFFVYFAKHFAKVKFPKRTRLAVCDLCVKLRTNKLLTTTKQEKRVIRSLMRDHTTLHRAERELYAVRKKDAQRCPEQSWSIIMDFSDKFLAPHKVCKFYIILIFIFLYNI